MKIHNQLRIIYFATICISILVMSATAFSLYSVRKSQTLQVDIYNQHGLIQDYFYSIGKLGRFASSQTDAWREGEKLFQKLKTKINVDLMDRLDAIHSDASEYYRGLADVQDTEASNANADRQLNILLADIQSLDNQVIRVLPDLKAAEQAGLRNIIMLFSGLAAFLIIVGIFINLFFRSYWRSVRSFGDDLDKHAADPGAIKIRRSQILQVMQLLLHCHDSIKNQIELSSRAASELEKHYEESETLAESSLEFPEFEGEIVIELGQQTSDITKQIINVRQSVAKVHSGIEQQAEWLGRGLENSLAMREEINASAEINLSVDHRLHEVERMLQSGNAAVVNTVEEMRSIERDIRGVLEAIPIINTIAERTSLLSMNASSESAHAGENGRGFSVVAEEIGKLAAESSQNAETIAGSLHRTVDQVQAALQASEESSEVFDRVRVAVEEFSATVHDITTGMSRLGSGIYDIYTSLQGLDEISRIVLRLSSSMIAATDDLEKKLLPAIESLDGSNKLLELINDEFKTGNHCQSEIVIQEKRRMRLIKDFHLLASSDGLECTQDRMLADG
ncbi:MAG: hypothetical protein D6B26_02810 [Spirochaetaceae bacterium]|nr:MAG: hypothetical protein D6B26_02810 [Spirochaetaceae bacterium]